MATNVSGDAAASRRTPSPTAATVLVVALYVALSLSVAGVLQVLVSVDRTAIAAELSPALEAASAATNLSLVFAEPAARPKDFSPCN